MGLAPLDLIEGCLIIGKKQAEACNPGKFTCRVRTAMEALSDTDRDLLRRSIRDFLSRHWPAEGAVERAQRAANRHRRVAGTHGSGTGRARCRHGRGGPARNRPRLRRTRPRGVPGAAAWRGGGQSCVCNATIECGARAARGRASGKGLDCAGARRVRRRCVGRSGRAARRCAVRQACVCRGRAGRRHISPCSSTTVSLSPQAMRPA